MERMRLVRLMHNREHRSEAIGTLKGEHAMIRSIQHAGWLALSFAISGALMGCSSAPADTTSEGEDEFKTQPTVVVIPLLFEEDRSPIGSHEAELKKAGKGEFPAVIEFTEKTFDAATKAFDDAALRVSEYDSELYAANPKHNGPGELLRYAYDPSEFLRASGPCICYRGNPKGVADLLRRMSDGVLSDQYTPWGWRYKTTKVIDENFGGEDSDFGTEWFDYDTKSTSVLIVNSSDDDGTGDSYSLIPPCTDTATKS